MSDGPSLWEELKRRRVVRVALIYAAVAWAVVEVADTVSPLLALPEVTPRLVLILVLLGFPLAIVLAWAFQVTPEGVERAAPITTGSRAPFFGGIAIGILAVAGVAFVFFGPDGGPTDELDDDLVAVLPFRASVPPELEYLGEGVMELLSARFDGEVGPRSADPGAVVAAATLNGNADVVARQLGAGQVLTGSVVGDAARLVVNVELRTVGGSDAITATAEASSDELNTIANQLAGQLLSLTAGEYEESLVHLLSTSPEALEAYLKGQQAWRAGDYFVAVDHFDEALRYDTAFALAGIGRADAGNMALGAGGGGGLALADRHRDRLSARDQAYLDARLGPGHPEPETGWERVQAWAELSEAMPDRVMVWYFYGETYFHAPLWGHADWAERSATIFRRALEVDPGHVPSLDHLLFALQSGGGGPDELQAAAARYGELTGNHWTLAGLAEGTGRYSLEIDDLPDYDDQLVGYAPFFVVFAPDYAPEDFLPYAEAAFAERRRRIVTDDDRQAALLLEYDFDLALGRPGEAEAIRGRLIREFEVAPLSRRALFSGLWDVGSRTAADSSTAVLARAVAGKTPTEYTLTDVADIVAVEQWRFATDPSHRDTDAAGQLRAAMGNFPRATQLRVEGNALLIEAWVQTRAGDSGAEQSLERLEELLRQGPGGLNDRAFIIALAALYEERGQARRALETLDKLNVWGPTSHRYIVPVWLKRARLAVSLGDTERASREYGRYLKVRRYAEPALQPEYEAAQAELAALTGG